MKKKEDMKHYTTIEQSKKLLELGLNPESSDMIYTMVNGRCTPFIRIETIDELEEDDVLCWSLGALLELVPHTGFDGIELDNYNDGKTIWTAIFRWKTDNTPIRIADTPLDAVYEVVVWLLENGYIKKEPKTSNE